MNEKRIRVNAKSNAKGEWQLDVTVEITGENVSATSVDVLEIIQAKAIEFAADGRKMAGAN